ncbi:MAG: VOC family protein [Acidobacteria bacterium]|nr:VOC family protein [Acidobacteriota bacterium]
MSNPAVYFEIPVSDLDRAVRFYGAVFGYQFQRETIDHNEMALFPLVEDSPGVSGALAKGEIYIPSKTGSLVYLHTLDIDLTLKKVGEAGGKILYPKTSLGALGFVAEFEDSEGNRVALHSRDK